MCALPIAAELDSPALAGDAVRTRPLRLLVITDTSISATGGSERFLRNLLSRLPSEHYEVTVVQLAPAPDEAPSPPRFEGGRVTLREFPVDAVYGSKGLRALHELRRLVREGEFDIVQSQHEKADLFNALLPRRAGTVHVSNRRDMGHNKSSRLRLAFRLLRRRFHHVVAPAESILHDLERTESLDAARMQCIPNGVDTRRFHPAAPAQRAAARDRIGLARELVVIGCVARLTEVKRHADLVDAFASVHRARPDTRLLLIGDGPLRQSLQEQIAALGLKQGVQLLGDREDVPQLLAALDLQVLASSTEGMSNALLEGMACGLPTVATRVGGNPQLIRDGENGLLVPACAPAALAEALLSLVNSPQARSDMSRRARETCERQFSLDAMAGAFDRMYQTLAQRGS